MIRGKNWFEPLRLTANEARRAVAVILCACFSYVAGTPAHAAECVFPDTGDFLITGDLVVDTSCEVSGILVAPQNLFVLNGATLTVKSSGRITLDTRNFRISVDPTSRLLVEPGGRVGTLSGSGGVVDGSPDTPPEMLTNPRHVVFTNDQTLLLEWTGIGDQPFTLSLPRRALPKWLPHSHAGDPILPDAHCGLNIRKAESIHWILHGEDLTESEDLTGSLFRSIPNVQQEEPDAFLGGVKFAGPIGECTDTEKQWQFDQPITESGGNIDPLLFPGLSLQIQVQPIFGQEEEGGNIDFIKDAGPQAEIPSIDTLFKDDSKKKLEDALKFWNELFKASEGIDGYCQNVGNYWNKVCVESPGSIPVCAAEVALLPPCGG